MTVVILTRMKTAISIPDPLFAAADELARRLGMSRSQLYSTAVAEYVRRVEQREVTARLDALYGEEPAKLDEGLLAAQLAAVKDEGW